MQHKEWRERKGVLFQSNSVVGTCIAKVCELRISRAARIHNSIVFQREGLAHDSLCCLLSSRLFVMLILLVEIIILPIKKFWCENDRRLLRVPSLDRVISEAAVLVLSSTFRHC